MQCLNIWSHRAHEIKKHRLSKSDIERGVQQANGAQVTIRPSNKQGDLEHGWLPIEPNGSIYPAQDDHYCSPCSILFENCMLVTSSVLAYNRPLHSVIILFEISYNLEIEEGMRKIPDALCRSTTAREHSIGVLRQIVFTGGDLV